MVPNLFLIGAQKGGSTNLFAYINQHPDITPFGKEKEPNIFCASTEEEARERLANSFCGENESTYYIDGSVNYTRYPRFASSVRNIKNICGEKNLKFIYILRNPVNRLISNYFWNAERFGESRSLELAIKSEEQYVQTSLYDLQIDQYLKYFDISQFYFVCFEDFIKSPSQESNKIFEWLELDKVENFAIQNEKNSTNKTITRSARFPIVNNLIWSFHPLRRAINKIFPQKVIDRMVKLLTRVKDRQEIQNNLKQDLLEKYFLDSIQRTAQLTGLNLSKWLNHFK